MEGVKIEINMIRLEEVLNNKNENYIFPFFWQHGEEESVLREYMDKIYKSGIRAVCIEARPHPNFVGDKWWKDVDIIIDEAKKKMMKVWILDDSHFPTGFANGRIKEEFPHLQKKFLKITQRDFVGPMKGAKLITKFAKLDKNDEIIGVISAKKINYEEVDPSTLKDITNGLKDDIVKFDLDEGEHRIFIIVKTFKGGEKQTEGYLNPIDEQATKILIDTVHEAHYKRYKDEFGKTIAGFFSDEPRFGNMHGADGSIGRYDMVLPWRDDMLELLKEGINENILEQLPLLMVNGENKDYQIRYRYMDLVSKLYANNFTKQIGDWCRSHGVEYIGHVIEDNNSHARLGYGTGHFFRGLWEQDMSGIDVVLHQIMPGMDNGYFKSFTSKGWDGEFFHYGLAKLGTSLGHIDPKKKGRTMCEVFGAYGWAEGIKLMKWITDHMLVRGVNHFVPHAFSPKEYPDPDCPPHFYAGGKNPQYRYFDVLMNYMNRMSHILNGGRHIAQVALLYHAEAEWSGEYMLFQKPAKVLTQNQIDFDIIPSDIFIDCDIKDESILINDETFKCMLIPYSQSLPQKLLEKILILLDSQIKVIFIDDLPSRSCEGSDITKNLLEIKKHENLEVVSIDDLSNKLKDNGIYEIISTNQEDYLRYYHYQQEDGDIFMFFNEHPYNSCKTEIYIPLENSSYEYDAFENKIKSHNTEKISGGVKFKLNLEAYESKVIIFDKNKKELEFTDKYETKDIITLENNWNVSFATAQQYPKFSNDIKLDRLIDLSDIYGYRDFSGTVNYSRTINIENEYEKVFLEIDEAYEIAEVKIDGISVGKRICKPYIFDLSEYIKEGEHKLSIEVTNTLVKDNYDFLSQFMIVEPTGIVGNVTLTTYIK